MRDEPADIPWKRFEKIARRIEAHLAPPKAVVTLDDHIRDKKTGQLRQVDASIRYSIGSVEILITIECRRHSDAQDVTWIEQLAKKRENIGANATIAVASAGFFKTAGISAGFENVYPRTLEELERNEGLDWLNVTHIDLVAKTYLIKQISIELYEPAEDDQIKIDDQLFIACSKRIDLYPFFVQTKTGKRYNSQEPIRLSELQGANWFEGNTKGSESLRYLKWECHDRGISVETNNGFKAVKFIHLEFATKLEHHQVPIENLFRYKKAEGPILEGAEFDMAPGLPDHLLTIYRGSESKLIDIALVPKGGGIKPTK